MQWNFGPFIREVSLARLEENSEKKLSNIYRRLSKHVT